MRSRDAVTPLRFGEDGAFTLVQLTDLHWTNGEKDDLRTRDLIDCVLDVERPDLVVLTGDMLAGRECRDPAASIRQLLEPIVERGLPFASVFGNHDDEGTASRRDLLAAHQALPGCLTEEGPPELTGTGNYVLDLMGRGAEAAARLYFLDSGAYAAEPPGGYAWIASDQVAWYGRMARRSISDRAEAGLGPVPALAFFHIPLPEYDGIWNTQPCRGHRFEQVCCPRVNSGMFVAMVEAGDVMGVFVGHDHVNDYEGEWLGIRLCYGRWGGYSTYGADRLTPGARVIQLWEGERSFMTWIRDAHGNKVVDLPINATAEPEG